MGYEWDIVLPGNGGYGIDACLATGWYDNLTVFVGNFMTLANLTMYETDGPYGGAACMSESHKYHVNYYDSMYHQEMMMNQFYAWLLGLGVFTNVPDWYGFAGANKIGYGYNEDQYNLPR